MEMQLLKRLVLGLFVTAVFISCKNTNSQNLDLSATGETTNYLYEKYITDYRLNIDGSTRAHHPFYNYLDCNQEGFFVVHFIPKTEALQSYWLHDFLKENSYEYDDAILEDQYIQKKLKGNCTNYNIFACHITKNHIEDPENCTEEALTFKSSSITEIYIYNAEQTEWKHLGSTPTDKHPLYYDSNYFEAHYPDLFAEKNQSETSKSLDYYQTNDSYFIKEIDVNKDQIPDMVVSSTAQEGNELIFFINEGTSYKLALQTINLSEDGGKIIDSIYVPQNDNVLAIATYFPDGSHLEATHYINFENNEWVLTQSVYITSETTAMETTTYTCLVPQNLSMQKLRDSEYAQNINHIPSEQQRDSECEKIVVKN